MDLPASKKAEIEVKCLEKRVSKPWERVEGRDLRKEEVGKREEVPCSS